MLKYLWMKYKMIWYLWTGLGAVTLSDWCGKQNNWSCRQWHGFIFFFPAYFVMSLKFSIIKNQKGKKQWKFSELLVSAWLNGGCAVGEEVAVDGCWTKRAEGCSFPLEVARVTEFSCDHASVAGNGPGARGEWQVWAQGRGLTIAGVWACPRNMAPVTLVILGTKGMALEVRSANIL